MGVQSLSNVRLEVFVSLYKPSLRSQCKRNLKGLFRLSKSEREGESESDIAWKDYIDLYRCTHTEQKRKRLRFLDHLWTHWSESEGNFAFAECGYTLRPNREFGHFPSQTQYISLA